MNRLSVHLYLFIKHQPAKAIFLGYFSYILFGWILLSLPFAGNTAISGIDNLFIAASAVSTTGLATINVAESYSFFGELIILILIQAGGLGYMTFSSFVVLATSSKLGRTRESITKSAFALPKGFEVQDFLRNVVIFTFFSEFIGAVALYLIFSAHGVDSPLWPSIFHSISAFCTAGFSLFPDSFESFKNSIPLNFTIALLSYLGAIGFIVVSDFVQNLRGKRKHLLFTSKVILSMTFWITLIGTVLFYINEPMVQNQNSFEKFLHSFFQVMTATTTVGFNTINIGGISNSILIVIFFLMIFGASPSGTGGGLKSTTLTALLALVKSILKGRKRVRFWKREIPDKKLYPAIASFIYYIFVLLFFLFFLTSLHPEIAFEHILFEAASALGTVGLSMGITGDLNFSAKCLIIVLMLMGRVGILTFGIAFSSHDETRIEEKDNDLVL